MSSKFQDLLAKAEKLQQKAERARGDQALKAYEVAAAAFQSALAEKTSAPDVDGITECHFGAGECLQCFADSLISICTSLPDSQLTQQFETETKQQAAQIFQLSIEHYRHVKNADGSMRVDAAVNCGNTLSSWADLVSGEDQVRLLDEAEQAYQHALQLEEDASTWSNLGDVLIQKAEALSIAGHPSTTTATLFASAAQSYARACSLSSSEDGDDLPGLLLNWGAGLITAAEHLPEQAFALLQEAAQRLRESISFNRGDTAPYNALGEAYVAIAEGQLKAGEITAAIQSASVALSDGYSGALQINAQTVDAFVGSAEAEAVAAKAYTSAGDVSQATLHWNKAIEYYTKALPSLTGWIKERSDLRYNMACCLCGAGKKESAIGELRELVAIGTVSVEEIRSDPDLSAIHDML